MCGKHCINNLLQAPIFDDKRMRTIAKKVDKLASQLLAEEELPVESDHFNTEGDFSIEVLKAALIRVNADLIPSRHPDASRIFKERDFYALVVQSHNHWFAVRRIGKLWVNLDSLFSNPDIIRDEEFKRWVQTNANHHNVFFVVGDIHIDHVRQEKVEPWILLHTDGSVTQTTGSLLRARDSLSPGGSSNKFYRDNGNLNNNIMDNGNSPIKNPRGFDNSNNMEQQPMPMPMLIDTQQRTTTLQTTDREQQLHRQRERQGNQRREQQVHCEREREQELLEPSDNRSASRVVREEKQLQRERERERQDREAAKEREEETKEARERQKEEKRQELERVQRHEQEQVQAQALKREQERRREQRERPPEYQEQQSQLLAAQEQQGQGRSNQTPLPSDQELVPTTSSRKQPPLESSASESPRDSPRERRERREEKKRQKQKLDASTPSTGSRAEGWTSPRVKEKNGFMMKEAKISPSTSKDKMMTGTVETIKEEKDERSVPQKLLDLGFDKSEVKFVAHFATDMDKAEDFFSLEPLIEKSDLQKENHAQRVTIEVSRCVKDIFDASTGGPVEMALFQLFRISQLGQTLARVIVLSSARYAIDLKQNLLTAVGRKLASEYFSKLEREFDNFARMKDMGFLDLEIRCALSMYTTSLGMAQACDILAQTGDSEALRHPELLGLLIASTGEDEAKAMLLRVVQFVVRNPDACTSDEVVDALKTQRHNLGSTGFQAATRLLEFMDNPGHSKRAPPTIPSMSSIMDVDIPKNGRLRRPPSMGALGPDDYHQTKDYKTVETFDTFNRMQEPTRALTQGSLKQTSTLTGNHYSLKNGLSSSDNDERRKPAPPTTYSATSPSLYTQQRETIVLEKKTAAPPVSLGSGSTSQLYGGSLAEREASFRNNVLNVARGEERAMNHNNTTIPRDKDERRHPNATQAGGGVGGASSSYQTYTSSGADTSFSSRGGLHSTPIVPSSTMKGSRKEPGLIGNIVPSSDAAPPGRGGPSSTVVGVHTTNPTRSSPTQPGKGIPDKSSLSLKPKTTTSLGVTKMGTFPPPSGLSRGISERGGASSGEQNQGLYTHHSSPQHTSSKSGGGGPGATTTHHHANTKTSPQQSFVGSPQQSSSSQAHAAQTSASSRRKEASGGGGGFTLSSAAGRSASLKASATKASSSTSVPQTDKVNLNSGYRPNMYTSGLGPDSLRRSHTPDSREERYGSDPRREASDAHGNDRRENPKMRSRDDRENSTRSISARVPDGRMRSEETLTATERNRYQDHARTYESDRIRDHIPKTSAYSSIDRDGPFSRERTTAAEERRVAREPIDRDIYGRPRDPTTRDVYGRAIDPERGNLFERPLDRYERSMQRERERERERNESAAYTAENNVAAAGPGRRNYGDRDYFTTTDQILGEEGRRIYAPKIGMDERGMSIGDYGRMKESYTRDPYTNIRGGVPSYADVPRAREETKPAAYGSDEHFYSRLWETRNSSTRRSHSTKDPWRFP